MALTERLAILIDAKSGGAVAEFRKVAKASDDLGDSAKKTGSIMDRTAASFGVSSSALKAGLGTAAVAAGGALVSFAASGVRAASDLEQSVGAVNSVFGKSSDAIFKFGETASQSAGLSKREVNEMAAVIGAQLQGMGFSAKESADEVINLEKRAADMAATFGGTTKDAIDAISATLRGERDPIERYGVSLKDVDVKARIAALGLDTSTVAAQKQATAVASLDLVMSGTAATQGQFAREGETLAGAQARLGAEMENLKATVGEGLTPALAGLASAANSALGPLDALVRKSNELGVTEKGVTAAFSPLMFVLKEGKARIDDVRVAFGGAEAATKSNTAATRANAAAVEQSTEKVKTQAEKAKELRQAIFGASDAQRAHISSLRALESAHLNVTEKQAALNKLLKSSVVDVKAVEAAQRSLVNAERSLASAQERQVAAAENLKRARGYDPEDLAEAQLSNREATLGVADALDRLESAQQELHTAQVAGDAEAADDALRALTAAQIGVERAQRAATAAQRAQNDLNPNSEAGRQRVAQADRELAEANHGVESAYYGVRDASVALATAQAGDVDRAIQITQARRDLAEAQRAVADAEYNGVKTSFALRDAKGQLAEATRHAGSEAGYLVRELFAIASMNGALENVARTLSGMVPGVGPTRASIGGTVGYRASGGSVGAGNWIVGERGPELLKLGTGASGHVTPNHSLGGGGIGQVVINMPPGSDGDDVVAALRRYQQRNGSIPISTRG